MLPGGVRIYLLWNKTLLALADLYDWELSVDIQVFTYLLSKKTHHSVYLKGFKDPLLPLVSKKAQAACRTLRLVWGCAVQCWKGKKGKEMCHIALVCHIRGSKEK